MGVALAAVRGALPVVCAGSGRLRGWGRRPPLWRPAPVLAFLGSLPDSVKHHKSVDVQKAEVVSPDAQKVYITK